IHSASRGKARLAHLLGSRKRDSCVGQDWCNLSGLSGDRGPTRRLGRRPPRPPENGSAKLLPADESHLYFRFAYPGEGKPERTSRAGPAGLTYATFGGDNWPKEKWPAIVRVGHVSVQPPQ